MSDTPDHGAGIVEPGEALRSARAALAPPGPGPDMADLTLARLGVPVLVRTTTGAPSYWLVPLESDDRIVGFARVMSTGSIGAIGRYGGPSALDLDADAVVALAADRLVDGEGISEPLLVHDGPPGREAWMLVAIIRDAPTRRLFVTPAGIYERGPDEGAPDLE